MKPIVLLLHGTLILTLFTLILWVATELWFRLLTDANTLGLPGAALDALGLALLAGIIWLLMRLLALKRAGLLTIILACSIWSIGNYYYLDQDSSNHSFSFFGHGQLMIENGKVTEKGQAIFLATLLSRLTVLAMISILFLAKTRRRRV